MTTRIRDRQLAVLARCDAANAKRESARQLASELVEALQDLLSILDRHFPGKPAASDSPVAKARALLQRIDAE